MGVNKITFETIKKSYEDGDQETLETSLTDAGLLTIADRSSALLNLMGISEEEAVLYAGAEETNISADAQYEAIVGTFFSGVWLSEFDGVAPLLCIDALERVASVYGWRTLREIWAHTQGFKAENLAEIINKYRNPTHTQSYLIKSIKTLRDFNDVNDEIPKFIESKIKRDSQSAQVPLIAKNCVFCVEDPYKNRFKVTKLKSTLHLSDDGAWVFHFIGNNKFPEEPPKNLGTIPLYKAVEFVKRRYVERYKHHIILGANILDALLRDGFGTEDEKDTWRGALNELDNALQSP